MFTIEQIKAAHAKVKSGADFPKYIQEMKLIGVCSYDHYVPDGHTDYYGLNGFVISNGPKYDALQITDSSSNENLQQALTIHQKGQTNYSVFCVQAAESGVEKWTVDMITMTCTYYNKAGGTMLTEAIPAADSGNHI